MAIGTSAGSKSSVGPIQPSASYDSYIETRLARTRRQVRFVDLGSAVVGWAIVTLAYLLALALIDHWIFDLGIWGRTVALGLFLAGSLFFLARVAVPLILRPINPAYAAWVIEESTPSLKNSLINFILFRSQRGKMHEAIYQALEQRAASDLSHVNLETAVDRSRLIHLGYVFVGILLIAALYKIFSPKDPFQTVSRVAVPWASISRPSRTELRDIQPGDADRYQGQMVSVTVNVRGIRESEPVTLIVSSSDQQLLEQPRPMTRSDEHGNYSCELPGNGSGLDQDLIYRIVAGDAVSRTYRIHVLPAPHISVERVEYVFPAYTRKPPEVVEGEGDIRALEGTRVRLTARANQPIRTAQLEFDPAKAETATAAVRSPRLAPLPLPAEGEVATGSFLLELLADGNGPKYSEYRVRFCNPDGAWSDHTSIHSIQVIRDLSPEVAILIPKSDRTEVPEDGRQVIEVRGIDPDFGLSKLEVRGVHKGKEIIHQELFALPEGQPGQVVERFELVPAELGLKAGDTLVYLAVAADNRADSEPPSPRPNIERTRNYQIVIVPPAKKSRPIVPDQEESPEPGSSDSKDREKGGEGAQSAGKDGQQGQTGGGSGGKAESGESGEGTPQAGQKGQSKNSQSGSGPKSSSGGSGQSQAEGGGKSQPSPSDRSKDSAGTEGGETSGAKAEANGPDSGEGSPTGQNASGKSSSGKGATEQPAADSPAAEEEPKGDQLHDGEVFEKVLRRMQQQGGSHGESAAGSPSQTQEKDNQAGSGQPQPPSGDSTNDGQNASTPSPGDTPGNQSKGGQNGDKSANTPSPSNVTTGQAQPENRAGEKGAGTPQNAQKSSSANESPDEGKGKQGAPSADLKSPESSPPKEPQGGPKGSSGQPQSSQAGAGKKADGSEQGGNTSQVAPRESPRPSDQDTSSGPNETSAAPQEDQPRKSSDSQSQSNGERAGGGKQGAGQGANQKGNDSAGSNSPADQGGKPAPGQGKGENSQNAGQDAQADGVTGESGQQPGQGSQQRPGQPQGKGSAGKSPSEATQEKPPGESPPPDGNGSSKGGSASGLPQGGGIPGDEAPANNRVDRAQEDAVPAGEQANLEYTRKATDLVLEYLKNQQRKPDERLLDELGWTPEDLQKFVERWERMKQGAREEQATGVKQLDQSLRSLGMRPPRDRVRQGSDRSDDRRGLRESGPRVAPPAKYREQYDAFRKGAARSTTEP